MSITTLVVFISLIPIFLVGTAITDLVLRPGEFPGFLGRFVLAFLLGAGFVAYVLFLVSLFFYPIALTVTMIVTFILAAGVFYQKRFVFRWVKQGRFVGVGRSGVNLFLFVSLLLLLGFVTAVSLQAGLGADGLIIWAFKAKVAFVQGGWPSAYFSDPIWVASHVNYPPLIPSLEAWVYTVLGRVDEQVIKWLFIFFYYGLTALFYAALRPFLTTPLALAYTILLTSTPYLASIAAVSGYVDVPLSVYLLGATLFLHRWLSQGTSSNLFLAGILTALAVWVKQDATVYWLFNTIFVLFHLIRPGKTTTGVTKRQTLVLYFGPSLLLVLPWFMFLAWHQVPNIDFAPLNLATLQANLGRLPVIGGRVFSQYLWLSHWGFTWFIWLFVTLWRWQQLRDIATLYLWGSAVAPFLLLTFTFTFSVWEPFTTHMDLSLDRLLLHTLPLVWYFIALQTADFGDWLQKLPLKSRLPESIK